MEKTQPYVILDLDKPRKYRLTLNAIVELEQTTGLDLEKPDEFVHKLVADKKSSEYLRRLLFLGLKWDDPAITEEEVGDMVDFTNFRPIVEVVFSYLGMVPVEEAGEGKNEVRAVPPRKRGAGKPPSKRPVSADSGPPSSTS